MKTMKKIKNYSFFTSKEIKPVGWLRQQLELQAKGLSGNLHKIWPDVRDSAWIGGKCEGWERVPYWLDGFVPLAYLLEDQELIAVSKYYVDAIIDSQKEDGWICPCEDDKRGEYDIWAVFLICKTLIVYYECSGDERAYQAAYKAAHNIKELLEQKAVKLFDWGKSRWFEMFIALCKFYERKPEEWILELGCYLFEHGTDYEEYAEDWKAPINKWTQETHIVNLGMMLKSEALYCRLFGGEYTDKAERLYKILKKYNGTAVGTFTGDECLSGLSPIQGTELCSVVELMYSFEHLFGVTGDCKWLDRLEEVAFNALPATISDDMWTHQYDQMVNQIACIRFPGRPIFRTNNAEAHLFGLEPHFGCCTANFNQGWSKLALSAFYRSKKGIVCGVRVPAILNTEINGTAVQIELKTEYPFRNKLQYKICAEQPVNFEFKIPIPKWAQRTEINGQCISGQVYKIKKVWDNDIIEVVFYDTPKTIARPEGMKNVCYGPLHFSLPIQTSYKRFEYIRNDVERKYPYCDYELQPESEWNYGLADEKFEVIEAEGDEIPFSSQNPRIRLRGKLAKINWGYEEGFLTVCRRKPLSDKAISEPGEKELYPYGCAKLRITEMQKVKCPLTYSGTIVDA